MKNEVNMGSEALLLLIKMLINTKEGLESPAEEKHRLIGKYVIVRTRNAGLLCGELVDFGQGFCELSNARRIWRAISKNKNLAWYEGVAESGLCEEKGVISSAVSTRLVVEDYEIVECSAIGEESLKNAEANQTTI